MWSLSETFYPSLELVQPRKTRPCLTKRLLMGRKESNQINKTSIHSAASMILEMGPCGASLPKRGPHILETVDDGHYIIL